MPSKNQPELSRTIPPEVKLRVRQRCGFGCVICGDAFYEYEHFSPEFKNAKEHHADGITLLCPTHHSAKTRNRMSIAAIVEANQNPKARQEGFSKGALEFGRGDPIIQIGNIFSTHLKI